MRCENAKTRKMQCDAKKRKKFASHRFFSLKKIRKNNRSIALSHSHRITSPGSENVSDNMNALCMLSTPPKRTAYVEKRYEASNCHLIGRQADSTMIPSKVQLFIITLGTSAFRLLAFIDYRCEDGRFLVSASCLAFSNPDPFLAVDQGLILE